MAAQISTSDPSQETSDRAPSGRPHGRARTVRALTAGVLVAVWVLVGAFVIAGRASTQNVVPPVPASATPQQGAQGETGMEGQARFLYAILYVANASCPADKPVLVLSNDPMAEQLSNYYLYPRVMDVVTSSDPLESDDIKSHAGGCVFNFITGRERLQPYMAQLDRLACLQAGCIYRIKP